jgi:hypothetical protein
VYYDISSDEKQEIFKSLAPQENQETEIQGAQVYYYPFLSLYTISPLGW